MLVLRVPAAEEAADGQDQALLRRGRSRRQLHRRWHHDGVHPKPLADVAAGELGVADEALVRRERGRGPADPQRAQKAATRARVGAVRKLDHRDRAARAAPGRHLVHHREQEVQPRAQSRDGVVVGLAPLEGPFGHVDAEPPPRGRIGRLRRQQRDLRLRQPQRLLENGEEVALPAPEGGQVRVVEADPHAAAGVRLPVRR